jgi:ribosomal protein S18 acetylase RimI-like enzyme
LEKNMVELQSMNATAFKNLETRAISDYASERVASGDWALEDADLKARIAFDNLLPDGRLTPQQDLWTIVKSETAETVGSVWVQERQHGSKHSAHVLDLYVAAPYRRQGIANEAMLQVEKHMRSRGVEEMTLHVFGRNVAALALYRGLGYQVSEIGMTKNLTGPDRP